MSLAVLANHMASKGRNGDSMLVHMAPSEVAGLQALGLSHGVSMTINPHTGLPEAFSFKSLLKSALPMIAGFALGPAGFGVVSSALGAGALVGGATALATGSLQKGLMAGLGAYGGASLGNAFYGAGSANIGTAAADAARASAIEQGLTGTAQDQFVQKAVADKMAAATLTDRLSAGITGLAQAPGRETFMNAIGGGSGLMKAGYAAAMPIMADQAVQTTTPMPGSQYQGTIRPYKFDPYTKRWTAQPTYPATPVKTEAEPAPAQQEPGGMAGGGIVALAAGGTPDMSGLSAAQRKYAEDLMGRQGQGTPDEILNYVKGLNDYQSLASLASVQGKQNWNQPSGFDTMKLLSEMYDTPIVNYGQSNAAQSPRGGIAELPAVQPTTLTPEQFKQQIYQDGADDVLATERGVNYIRQAGLTPQESLDLWNKSLGTNFGMADYERVMKQFPAAKSPVTPIAGPVVPGTIGQDKTYGGTDVLDRVTPPTPGTPGNVTQENLTMDQVRNDYEQGGGATEMPTVTRLGPNERPMTQNAVVDSLQSYLEKNPNATSTEITAWGRANGVPDYQLRAAVNERRFSMMTGGTKNAYDYLMGRGAYPTTPFVPGGGPIMRPYSEVVGGESAMRRYVPPAPSRQTAQGADTGAGTTGTTGTTNQAALDRLRSTFDRSIFNQTPDAKAAYYNSLLAAGYDDATIRAAIDAPLDENWLALQAIAARLRAGTTGGSGASVGGGSSGLGGVLTLGNSYTGGSSSTGGSGSSTTGSGTPITDFLFGTQDASKVPVEDRTITRLPDRMPERSEYDASNPNYTDEELALMAGMRKGGLADVAAASAARGGQFNLGGYSDGGRLLRGPGDGVSDSIPATIGNRQPARLADGEFVIPARIVSEIGNGSTEAGARKLYAMMDRVQRARAKTTGKGKVAKNTRADKYLPA